MKLNDLAFSINIGGARLCHQCAATPGGVVVLGLSKALSQRGSEKRSRKLVKKKKSSNMKESSLEIIRAIELSALMK